MSRVKNSEVFPFKLALLEKQNWICPLCKTKIEVNDSAMDHDHKTGAMRAVLHDRCNRALGFIEWAMNVSDGKFLEHVQEYLDQHTEYPSPFIHPKHERLTAEKQKRVVKLSRFELLEEHKSLYLAALEEGPIPHPNPKKHTSKLGSWKRTADKYGINHGRLLAYVTGARPKTELETA